MMCDRCLVIYVVFECEENTEKNDEPVCTFWEKIQSLKTYELTLLEIFIYFARLSREGQFRNFLFLGEWGV